MLEDHLRESLPPLMLACHGSSHSKSSPSSLHHLIPNHHENHGGTWSKVHTTFQLKVHNQIASKFRPGKFPCDSSIVIVHELAIPNYNLILHPYMVSYRLSSKNNRRVTDPHKYVSSSWWLKLNIHFNIKAFTTITDLGSWSPLLLQQNKKL